MKRRNVNEYQLESLSLSSKKTMQESREEPCGICGSVGIASSMMVCSKCRDTREHAYCSKVFQHCVPPIWICEACRFSSRVLLIPGVAENQMDSETIVVDRSSAPTNSHSSRVDGMEEVVATSVIHQPMQPHTSSLAKETSSVLNDSSQSNEQHQPSQAFPKKRKTLVTLQLMGKHISL